MDAADTGRFIADLRKEKGYTQKDLAEKLAVTDKAVSRWETGKGLPDTALLKPLADELGVSVGELLAGERIPEPKMQEQTDRIILDSLRYSGRMLSGTTNYLLAALGLVLLLSPLVLAGGGYFWIGGLALLGLAALGFYQKKTGRVIRVTGKGLYAGSTALHGAALLLELLPYGAVLVFATGPEDRLVRTFSYFNLILVGYGNFTPLLTGILTAATLLQGFFVLGRFDRAKKIRNLRFGGTVLALALSMMPPVLFGRTYWTAAGAAISLLLGVSLCIQAAVNRKEG